MAILPLQLARVSNLLRTSVANQQISRTQQQLLQVQNELSSGKRLNAASDNPGDAAIVLQLQKLLQQRQAYAVNLNSAQTQLSEVDSTLSDLTDLLRQAQQIASANVGSDATADQRAGAAAVVASIYSQVLSIGNKQFQGSYLFAGDRSTDAPFVESGGGVRFVGSRTLLKNTIDENTSLSFMIGADSVFGALSTRVQGTQDLSPSLSEDTRLADLKGALGRGIRLGSIRISDGSTAGTVNLSGCDTVGDVIDALNAAGVGGITASIGTAGNALQLTGGAGQNISVSEIGGGTTAADLGLLSSGAGAGNPLVGVDVRPSLTLLTPLASLRHGQGLDCTGLIITNGLNSATVDFSACTTVQDMLNVINSCEANVLAEINADGTGINILNPTQGTRLAISENGGLTASQLGVRSFSAQSLLGELNQGKGVGTATGGDFLITRRDGTSFSVSITGARTVQDVINAINAADGGMGVTASFAVTGNGIMLTDGTGGSGSLTVTALNFSTAAHDLGLEEAAAGDSLQGADVNVVQVNGIFANLQLLQQALQGNDTRAITAAAEGLYADTQRLVLLRGQTGARVQEMESRLNRLEDQNLATKSLLSTLQDTDFTDAVSRFQTLQTALTASLQTSAQMMNLSLLDFLA